MIVEVLAEVFFLEQGRGETENKADHILNLDNQAHIHNVKAIKYWLVLRYVYPWVILYPN